MSRPPPHVVLLTATIVAPPHASNGRGYGEFKLVDHAMQHSAVMGQDVHVWKVSGRYRIRNLAQLIRSQPAQADLYCHCRNLPTRWLDMYLMRWNRRADDALIRGVYRRLRQDASPTSAEQHFRALVDAHPASLCVVYRFTHVPRIDGVRGFDGRPYGSQWRQHVVRVVAHRLTQWIWV